MSTHPKPRKKSVATLDRQIKACVARIAAERDKLRDLTAEANEIADDCDDAIQNLESATDALSRLL